MSRVNSEFTRAHVSTYKEANFFAETYLKIYQINNPFVHGKFVGFAEL